ncbi:MAG: alpha-L-fucosidase, partial [Chitinophagaceae bacterium]
MRVYLMASLFLFLQKTGAQTYQPNWESLDQRPLPQWYKDSKFGIFIHWGVYAVPGWSTKGNYAEWYQQGLQTKDSARQLFHQKKFGGRSYYQLADDFKAELYNPDEWAKLIEYSGAKYVVLTSKHHDGFALWPSAEASRTWGFPWNAVEAGPKRDVLGELFKALRKTTVHAGMYYSLYEWFHPLWLNNRDKYVQEHMWPQMKELINRYQPDVFWTDGDWDATAETWKSPEFIAWLYNESPVKEKIVVNDRWGSGVRFRHGGIYTPEYQPNLDFEDHYWEESRGMGYSYGYNREEDAWDYNSAQSLILALVDKVSRGGNFLLDIGPDEHGKIPPIMQERLLQIGEWMAVHGEAIYGTTRWKMTEQWSEGNREVALPQGPAADWKKSTDFMLKLTVDPEPGYAVKEVFYTYQPQTNAVYAILPRYPSSRKILLRDIVLPQPSTVSFISLGGEKLSWQQKPEGIEVNLPEYDPNRFKAPYAYVLKLSSYGSYHHKPKLVIEYPKGQLHPQLTFSSPDGATIYYTLDGKVPGKDAAVYTKPFRLDHTAVVKAIAVGGDRLSSAIVSQEVQSFTWQAAVKSLGPVKPGLRVQSFEAEAKSTADLAGAVPVKTSIVNSIDTRPCTRPENAGLRFEGFLKIEEEGLYTFSLVSDDGSRLWLDNEECINHDGLHGNDEKKGLVALKKGLHKIRLDYIQATGGSD